MPQPSQISIYNLSRYPERHQGKPHQDHGRGGWNNTDLRKVFQGSIMSSSSERNGPDIVTKLVALPGYGSLVRGVSSVTFGAGTPVSVAAQKLASDLPGMTVQGGNFQGVAGNIGPRGWSYAGSTKDGLTRLGEEHGFSWSVQDGEVTAIGDRFMLGSYVELNGENGGLISIAPTLTGPMQIQSGVKIKALYIPGISAGHSIKVNSTLNPRLSGTYRIHTMSINIDAYSEAWTMDIESFRFPPGKKVMADYSVTSESENLRLQMRRMMDGLHVAMPARCSPSSRGRLSASPCSPRRRMKITMGEEVSYRSLPQLSGCPSCCCSRRRRAFC
ncbi:MAG: baseplate hub protein [Bilophila wadsworthia]